MVLNTTRPREGWATAIALAVDVSLAVSPQHDHLPFGCQRCGQDDADSHSDGSRPAASPEHSLRYTNAGVSAAASDTRRRDRLLAGGQEGTPDAHDYPELASRCTPRDRCGNDPQRARRGARAVSTLLRSRRGAGGDGARRRAGDARDRSRLMVVPQTLIMDEPSLGLPQRLVEESFMQSVG